MLAEDDRNAILKEVQFGPLGDPSSIFKNRTKGTLSGTNIVTTRFHRFILVSLQEQILGALPGMDSYTESTPPSDGDSYSSSEKTNYAVDRSNFPKPFPVLGPLLGYDDKFFAHVTKRKVERTAALLKRPVTNDEVNAMAYWAAKQISIISYSTPVGVAGGLYRWWQTFDRFRFPFYGPNMETFNPYEFPNKMALLRGPRAPYAWHFLRVLFYAGFGKFAASLFFGSYAMSVAAVGELGDSRLKDVRAVIQKAAQAQAERGGRPGQFRFPQRPDSSTTQSEAPGDSSPEVPYDDASPAGGMYLDESKETDKPNVSDFDQSSAEGSSSPRPQPRQWPQYDNERSESQDSPFKIYDEDSPIGGQGMVINPPANPNSSPSTGSAWERIRSGQKPVSNRPSVDTQRSSNSAWAKRQRQPSEGSPREDSFSASASQEARRYSREEAQREFDAKVERERRGGDFTSNSGDPKRW